MISLEVNHAVGLGALFTIAASQLLKMPDGEDVWVHLNSSLYAPQGENMWEWYFQNPTPRNQMVKWPGGWDANTYQNNTKLGRNRWGLARLRKLRKRRFVPILGLFDPKVPANAVGINYRGTDKYTETPRIPYENVLRSYQLHGQGRPAFLVTDEKAAAEWFQEKIPGIVMHPHLRINGKEGLHVVHGGRDHANEAMLDLWCLSRCSTLLLGRGNYSDWAAIFGDTEDIHYHEDSLTGRNS